MGVPPHGCCIMEKSMKIDDNLGYPIRSYNIHGNLNNHMVIYMYIYIYINIW